MLFVLSLPVKCDGTVPASVFLHPCPTSREKPACRQSHSQGKEMRPRMHDKPKRTAAQVRGQGMHKRMRTCTTPVRRRTQHEQPGTFRAANAPHPFRRSYGPDSCSALFALRCPEDQNSFEFSPRHRRLAAPEGRKNSFGGRHRTKSRGRERSAGLACEPPAVRKDSRPRS